MYRVFVAFECFQLYDDMPLYGLSDFKRQAGVVAGSWPPRNSKLQSVWRCQLSPDTTSEHDQMLGWSSLFRVVQAVQTTIFAPNKSKLLCALDIGKWNSVITICLHTPQTSHTMTQPKCISDVIVLVQQGPEE